MKHDLTVKVRLAGSEMARLDEMRGPTSRAGFLRRLLQGPPPEGDPTHNEAVHILYGLAKDGKVGAAVALERALRGEQPSGDGDCWQRSSGRSELPSFRSPSGNAGP